jgi:hypothetical protein
MKMKKQKKRNSSQENYKKYYDYRMGKGKPEKLKNAVLQHPEDTDDSIYGYMQKNKSRNAWVMNFDQYRKLGESNSYSTSESLYYKKNQEAMVIDYNNFNKVNEDEDFLNDLLYGEESETSTMDKWQVLEKDIMNLVNKHSGKFGVDSYGVIDAIYQVMDQMFEKIEK